MVDCFTTTALVGLIVLTAATLLAVRDKQQRRLIESPPVADRIREISREASFMAEELQSRWNRPENKSLKERSWVPPMIEHYRKLSVLASMPTTTREEVLQLAEICSELVRKHWLQGIPIVRQANELAGLLSERKTEGLSETTGAP